MLLGTPLIQTGERDPFRHQPDVSLEFARSLPSDVPRWPVKNDTSTAANPRVTPLLESYDPG
jgi:hypothetical protein